MPWNITNNNNKSKKKKKKVGEIGHEKRLSTHSHEKSILHYPEP